MLAVVSPAHALSQIDCKAYTLFREANTEGLRGQRATLDVIETRMKKYKKTACQVMMQRGQFSFFYRKSKIVIDTQMMKRYYVVNEMQPVFKGAEFFHHVKIRPKWEYKKLVYLGTVGKHTYYKRKEK